MKEGQQSEARKGGRGVTEEGEERTEKRMVMEKKKRGSDRMRGDGGEGRREKSDVKRGGGRMQGWRKRRSR